MRDREWTERFGADLDHLFRTGTVASSGGQVPAEYAELLSFAQKLSRVGFSDQSQVRQALCRRLLARMDARKGWRVERGLPIFALFQRKRYALVLLSLVLVGLLIANLSWSGGLIAAAQSAIDFVQRLVVGEHTTIEPISPELPLPESCEIVVLDEAVPIAQGTPGEPCDRPKEPPSCDDQERVIGPWRRFGTISEAQAVLAFTPRQPTYLPGGYTFQSVRVLGEGELAVADLHYDGPGGRIVLSQRPVGGQADQTVSIGLPRVSTVQTVEVNGHTAMWAEHTLLWEADGISYFVTNPGLSLTEAVRIAESLK